MISTSEQSIFNYLKSQGFTDAGASSAMANMLAESGLNAKNLQNSFEKKLGHTDETYTAAVDSGAYTNFANDKAGYGLCQWTYPTRKAALLAHVRAEGKSIGDEGSQLRFFIKELRESYPAVLAVLQSAKTVREASDAMLLQYERPADQSEAVRARRASYGQIFYYKYAAKGDANNVVLKDAIMTENPCYKAGKKITVKGLMLHSVGCSQPNAQVFIKNWNKASHTNSCVHAFIDGNDGTIYQTLPWNHRGWHCGAAANNTHIGVEMCEPACIKYTGGATFTCSDPAKAKAVAQHTYRAAVELFAMLCRQFGLDPMKDGVILSHKEGHARNVASNHGDPEHLWTQLGLGYTMNGFRADVKAAMGGSAAPAAPAVKEEKTFSPYMVKIDIPNLNIRKGPGTSYPAAGFTGKGVFTIVEESAGPGSKAGWGRLKSGVGWVSLDYVKRV